MKIDKSINSIWEQQRVEKLHSLEVLDTEDEVYLDNFVKLASKICEVPISLISLVDESRQWFKSRHGLEATETPREYAFCAQAIKGDGPFIVENSLEDERFKDNPLVTGGPKVIFYAGVPLKLEGHNLGTICVIDHEKRKLSQDQINQLTILAQQISMYLEQRKKIIDQKKISQMLNSISLLKISEFDTIGTLVEEMLGIGTNLLNLEFGIQSRITDNSYVVEACKSPDDVLEQKSIFELENTYCEAVIEAGKTITYKEVNKLESLKGHPVYVNMKLESYISTPIWVNGEIYGTLSFSSKEVKKIDFSAEEIQFVEILGSLISKKLEFSQKSMYAKYIQDIINEAPEFIGMSDAKTGKTLYHNKAFDEITGMQVDSKQIKDFHPEWAIEKVKNIGIPHAIKHKVWKGETAILNKDGVEVPVLQTIVSHRNEIDEVIYISTIMQDITIQKEIEHKHFEAKEDALKVAKLKSQFLANMSHEIRTPMNGIIGMVNFLFDTKLDKNQHDMLTTISKCSEGLLTLLNDILDLSKIESQKLVIDMHELSLIDTLTEVRGLFIATASSKKIKINMNFDLKKGDEFVIGDSHRIKQIMNNFVSNAIKFSPPGKIDINTSIVTRKGREVYKLSVKDYGIGIDKNSQDKIFKAFSQADSSITRKFGGTGLGLSISTKLSSLMGGEIDLVSEKDCGSEFSIYLPLKKSKKIVSLDKIKEIKNERFALSFPHTILVVEDNLVNQKVINKYLDKLGYKTKFAFCGEEAIELVKKYDFTLIFMDMQMPNMDGVETTRHLNQIEDKDFVVVALTANVLPEDKERCKNVGMVDFLTKPLSLKTLRASIEMITPIQLDRVSKK